MSFGTLGRTAHRRDRRVIVVGRDDPSTEAVAEAVTAFEVGRVRSVATLSADGSDAVVLVAPALGVDTDAAVDAVRRAAEVPVVVAADEVPATTADAVTPLDPDAVERTVSDVVGGARIDRTRRRVGRLSRVALRGDGDLDSVCEGLAGAVGYDAAWVVEAEDGRLVPVAAAGIAESALGAVETGTDVPWAEALETGETVVDRAGDGDVVAVPFGDRCLVCSSDRIGPAEVEALERVGSTLATADGTLGSRYSLLGEAVAHEVNNQLDLATVHLELLDDDGEHLQHVEAALERIGEVVDEVNALVAPAVDVERVDLTEAAGAVWGGVAPGEATLETADATVEADPKLLRLLLTNLFRNAVQHGGDDVTVAVGPTEDGGFVVADDGPGFDDGEALFEWGYSGAERTGIGLALVSLVADRHGWDVDASGDGGGRFAFRPST